MASLSAVASAAKSGTIPRMVHAGVNAVYTEYTITATLSDGDVVDLCFLPDGARVIQVNMHHKGDIWDGKVNIGTAADHDFIIASSTFQTSRVLNGYGANVSAGAGVVVDVSDDAATRYATIKAKFSDAVSASGSNAGTLKFYILYHMDQPPAVP